MRRIRDLMALKDDLRTHVDMVAFIAPHVDGGLTQRGKNWWGLCPFHEESTGSFNVTPDIALESGEGRGLWSCLGCREAGDLFDFTQRVHNCNFTEALEILAEFSKFDLNPYYRELSPEEELLFARYEVMGQIADAFHSALRSSPQHLHFFAERGIEIETLERFKIGYCPSLEWLATVVDADILQWVEPIQNHRERLFNGHLLYPQFTAQGQIWGWFARQEPGVQPKYIGPSREAALFEGGARTYGLFHARQLLRQSKQPLLIVEGFHDAMVSQQAHIATVAVCGTELSDDQVKSLHAHAVRNGIVCFDDDEGGRSAMLRLANRSYEIESLNLKFVRVPGEPSEFIAANGADAFRDRLQNAVCAIEYVLGEYADLDVSTPTKIRDFLDHVRPHLSNYPRNHVDRALGIKRIAEMVGLAPVEVADFFEERTEQPLANPRAEIVLLAEFALNPQAWVLYDGIAPDDFSLQKNQQAFDLMQRVYQHEAEVNPDLLLMVARNERAPVSVIETIEDLPRIARNSQDALLKDVRDKALRRKAQQLALHTAKGLNDLMTPAPETLGAFIESVTSMVTGRKQKTVFSSVEATMRAIQAFEDKSNADTDIAGLDMGPDWAYLMRWINGLRGGRVHVVAATSGVGKSIFGLTNVVHSLSVRPSGPQAAGLVISMEMDTTENISRLVSVDSGVPNYLVERARFDTEEQADAVSSSFERIYEAPLRWMEQQRTLRDIALQARMMQASPTGLQYVVLDYIQLLDLSPYNNRWSTHEKYGQASQDLHALAASLDVPIIAIAQLNRTAYEQDIPTGEQMGGAYKIYQDAHACYTLTKRNNNITLGFLDKNRGGPDKKAVDLEFNRDERTATLRMRELSIKGHNEV